ncbi:spike glycoprotein [Common moorhen coronavirus HKU21]|uniref:Spike glycoprotein n=1 Tax=Common moorhen coronavirus HKU21 TaxID=1159902 RepID=H9BR35_9NIDO|nr:spike glycoprotein [Common moorhen coronavirus HKU21]AFD29244.1 spike glycoprotein [Common moorhen coronavirus HKU21]
MQRFVLTILFVNCVYASFADTILDTLTFPGFSSKVFKRPKRLARVARQMQELTDQIILDNNLTRNFHVTNQGNIYGGSYLLSYITNNSYPIFGVYRSYQPLLVRCVFSFSMNGNITGNGKDWVYTFNPSTTNGNCNSPLQNKYNGTVDAIRFVTNFSAFSSEITSFIFRGEHEVSFSCSNTSNVTAHEHLLIVNATTFKSNSNILYCYFTSNFNGTLSSFYVGPFPPNIADVTIFRSGNIYVNGYYLGYIGMSIHNFSTHHVGLTYMSSLRGIFTDQVDVLVNISNSVITNIVYCNHSLVNQIKCQRHLFDLPDGFYSYSSVSDVSVPETVILLPKEVTYSRVKLTAFAEGNIFDGVSLSSLILSENKTNSNTTFNDTICVDTTYFNFYLKFACGGGSFRCSLSCRSAGCPFDLQGLNNYLSFDHICFSLLNNGGCPIQLLAYWGSSFSRVLATIYVSYSPGTRITGSKDYRSGFIDQSIVTYNECTNYNIYGITGQGVITQSDLSLPFGLYYTSYNGDLVAFKNLTNSVIYTVMPCHLSRQIVVYNNTYIGTIASQNHSSKFGFESLISTPTFYYYSNNTNCSNPVLTYGELGICSDGGIKQVLLETDAPPSITPMFVGNISVPTNFTLSVQNEYFQIQSEQVVIDCGKYVCNGNYRCLQLLSQYTSACSNIESTLHGAIQLDSVEVSNLITTSKSGFNLANISNFQSDFNFTMLLADQPRTFSAIEDLLFNKVVTNGLGTVDQDYKKCSKGLAVADLACAQYYNGIMVLPGVVDAQKLAMYTASLTGGMVFGGVTAAAAVPFSTAVQARLNYVALQTNVLQENQKILAESFNSAISNISLALTGITNAIEQTSESIVTMANAINKIQTVVNEQGEALSHLTIQLSNNFQAISSSIQDIYNRLSIVEADQQVDRLITGRLAALNAYVTQLINQLSVIRQSRELANQKINECVKSQSQRYGFCGNGTHLFSITTAAPNGIMFMHAVLVPTAYQEVEAIAGICVNGTKAFTLREPMLALYKYGGEYRITSRRMYEPRLPTMSDFIPIQSCIVQYINVTQEDLPSIIPDYVDVNSTVDSIINSIPNVTYPDLDISIYNQTILNLTQEITDLQGKANNLSEIAKELQQYIDNLNNTLVDLEWLNRVETYIKWPWYIWLLIFLSLATFVCIVVTIFLCTGCCGGCFGCFGGCCGLFRKHKFYEEDTKQTPVFFKVKEW